MRISKDGLVKWGVVGFLVWFLVKNPDGAAVWVNGAIGFLGEAANSVSTFLSQVGPGKEGTR